MGGAWLDDGAGSGLGGSRLWVAQQVKMGYCQDTSFYAPCLQQCSFWWPVVYKTASSSPAQVSMYYPSVCM